MKRIDWYEMGGAAVAGALEPFVVQGKIPGLNKLSNADVYVNAGLIALDLFYRPRSQDLASALDGAATGAAALLVNKFVGQHVASTTATTSTTSTSTTTAGMASFAMIPAPAYSETPDMNAYGDY